MDGKTITVQINTVQGSTSGGKKVLDQFEKEALASQKRIEAQSKAADKAIADSKKTLVNNEITELKRLEKEQKQVANNFIASLKESGQQSGSAFSSAFAGGIAGGALVAGFGAITNGLKEIAGYASEVGHKLFEMAKDAAELGGSFGSLQTKTGLSADAISALNLGLSLAHKELSDITRPLTFFTTLIGKASKGSEEAAKTLHALGVTDFSNLQGALDQVFQRIEKLPPGIEQMNAAADAFGRRGGVDMIAVIHKMGGSFDDTILKAKELGITLSQDDINAAREFNKAYTTLGLQIKITSAKIATEYMPWITHQMQATSDYISKNKDDWAIWGKAIKEIMADVGPFVTGYLKGIAASVLAVSVGLKMLKRVQIQGPKYPGTGPTIGLAPPTLEPRLGGGIGELSGGEPDTSDFDDYLKSFGKSSGGASKKSAAKDAVKDTVSEIDKAMKNPQVLAFFSALSTIEGGGQFTVFGSSGPRRANTLDPRHPGAYLPAQQGPGGKSTASGYFQETYSNWKRLTPILGLTDFRDPEQQLKVALYLFQEASGGKGLDFLTSGNYEAAAKSGTQPWAASPYSTLRGGKRKDFLGLVNRGLSSGQFGLKTSDEIAKSQQIDPDSTWKPVGEVIGRSTDDLDTLIKLYSDLAEKSAHLNELTEKENFLLDVKLGKYPDLNQSLVDEIANQYDLIDARKKQIDEAKKAAEDQADWERKVTEETEKLKRKAYDETRDIISESLDSLSRGDIKGLGKSFLERSRRSAVDKTTDWLMTKLGWDNPNDTPELREAKKQTHLLQVIAGQKIGGVSQNIGKLDSLFASTGSNGYDFSGLSGGSSGYGGITGDHGMPGGPTGGSSSGGFDLSQLMGGKLFGPRANLLKGGKLSKMGGVMGGIGDIATMVGGAIGGKWGNLISMAGTGASMGASFGPWGAAIGAAIGGGIGLIQALFGGDNAVKKIKEAALSTYGISIKDKSVLNSIKAIGETYFGKGKVGANATQLMQVDEVKNILRNYAQATGQNGDKIDMLSHGDENWSGNQMRSNFGGFKATGGRVTRGMSYIVGERGPERFVASASGQIVPNSMSDPQMKVIMARVEEVMTQFATKLQSFSPGHVVAMGASERPDAISDAYHSNMEMDLRASTELQRKQGIYR